MNEENVLRRHDNESIRGIFSGCCTSIIYLSSLDGVYVHFHVHVRLTPALNVEFDNDTLLLDAKRNKNRVVLTARVPPAISSYPDMRMLRQVTPIVEMDASVMMHRYQGCIAGRKVKVER